MICIRCVMDETDPGITFDENGICNHCSTYLQIAKRALKPYNEIFSIIEQIKADGKEQKYDGAIGISGGKDSSYAAYLAHQFGLRLLAIHFDNGYNTPEGIYNVNAIIDNTGWDFIHKTVDPKEFHSLQLAYLESGVLNLEAISDHAIRATVYKVAAKYKLKYIIKGNNWVTEGILPKAWGYKHVDLMNIKSINRKYGSMPLKTFPMLGPLSWYSLVRQRDVKDIKILNYVDYNVAESTRTLAKEWGLKDYGWKHGESVITRFFQHYILPLRWGYDKRKAHLSSLICSDQISRVEALTILEAQHYESGCLESDYINIISKLGISSKEFKRLMRIPQAKHEDFPSDQWVYNIIKLGRRIVRKMGFKR